MATADEQIILGGQRAIAVQNQTGSYIYDGGATDIQCVINSNGKAQRAIKAVLIGKDGQPIPSDLVSIVATLPETGEEGKLYLVQTEITREGYVIYQEFVWDNNAWRAIGAFDVSINPTGLVYEQSFNASTGTWIVTVSQ